MRRTLIILVSVAVNLLSNAGTDAYVISKAGAAAGSYAVSSSGSYSGATAHAGAVAGSGTYGGHQLSTGDAAQSIAKAGAITHSGLHYGGAGSQTGGSSYCPVCKHQSFPGPNGSIHDYKLASAVSTAQSSSSASATGSSTYQQPAAPAVINLPAAPGNIYSSKPATSSQSAAASSSTYDIGHLSPSLVASFPGPSGSIHDSKPATAAAVAVAGATASSGSNYHVAQPVPVVQPAPAVPNPQLSQIIPVFPGKPGSIYSSKPVAAPGHVKETPESSSGYHDESGSITNIPDHVKTSPSCRYVPGAGGSCGSNVAVEHNENVASNAASAVAGAITGADYHHHVVVPVPERELVGPVPHNPQLPQIIPVFPGNPGSIYSSKPVAAGSQNVKETNVFEHNASNAAATSSSSGSNYHVVPAPETDLVAPVPSSQSVPTPVSQFNPQLPQIIPVFPGQPGSIHSSKPVVTGSQHVKDESASHSASSGNYHDESGSITNIPTHANSGSSCRYVPGLAGNNCGSSGQLLNIDNSLSEVSNSGGAAEAGVSLPSVHPETPLSGTYYINKPSVDLQTPENSFSGQIPCGGGSSCGSTVNQGLSHDAAHLSGGIVFQNEDGSYHGHTTSKPVYKNAENGNYAVSSNSEDNKGILIGPGTGHLPIEESKPFGTQGAFGGSAAFSKSNSAAAASNQQTLHSATIKEQPKEPFGTQGAFGGSAAFSKSNSASDQQQLATQGDLSNSNSYGDKSGSYGGHGTFGGSKTGAASVAFAKAGSNEIKAAPAGLIDVRNIDDGRLTSGSFVKSSSSAHSFASASSSAVSYSGSF